MTHQLRSDLPACHCGAPAQLSTVLIGDTMGYWVECSDYDCCVDGYSSGAFEVAEAAISEWRRQHQAQPSAVQP